MKDVDIATYTNRFNNIATLCPSFVTPEYKKVERYIWGLVQPIQGLVIASRLATYDSAKQLAFNLTNEEIRRRNMVQKANLPKPENNNRKFGRGYKGNLRQSAEKKQETVKSSATKTTTTFTHQKQYVGK